MDEAKYELVVKELHTTAGKVRQKGREYEISRVAWASKGDSGMQQMPELWEPIGADVVDRLVLERHLRREDIFTGG